VVHHRPARHSARLFRTFLAIAVLVGGVTLTPLDRAHAQDASTDAPVLWSGRLLDKRGHPTRGEITAFLRPPAGALPSSGEFDADALGLTSVPLTSDSADADGRFELRAEPDTATLPRKLVDGMGALTVMLFAVSESGEWTVATDTVWYLDELGTAPAWFTSHRSYEAARALRATSSAEMRSARAQNLSEADRAEAAAGDRPADLRTTLPAVPGSPPGQVQAAAVPPGGSYVGCTAVQTVSTSWHFRTADMVDLATYWKHRVEYKESNTTSWEVGYSASGTGGWSLAGSASFNTSSVQGVYADFNSGPNPTYRDTFRIGTNIKQLKWRCGTTTSPGPYTVYTAEAYGLNWQTTRTSSGDDIGCNLSYTHAVGKKAGYWRENGQSTSLWGNVGIWGFYGGQKVTTSAKARYNWYNDSAILNRNLCGETGSVTAGHSRVSALA
jgi:hypothetical protein